MKDLEEKVNDQDWLLSNLERPPTFLDRLRFYLYTRFNRRPYKSFRCISIKGGFIPKLFLYNGLVNSKYNLLTFVPLVLYSQFSSFINLFYLGMCLSQLVPVLRVESPIVHMFPLSLVIFVYSLKEGIEDYKRHVRDKEHNRQQFCYFSERGYVEVASEKIKLGQLLMLKQGERVPADILLLKTSEPNGASFVRTDQLDGETDWKLKRAVATTQAMSVEDTYNLLSVATVEEPKPDFYNFLGKITFYFPIKREGERSRPSHEADNTDSIFNMMRSSSSDLSINTSITTNTFTNNTTNVNNNTATVTNNFVDGSPKGSNSLSKDVTAISSGNNGKTGSMTNMNRSSIDGSNPGINKSSSGKAANGNCNLNRDNSSGKFTRIGVRNVNYDLVVESLNVDNVVWMNSIVASGTIHGLVIYIGKDARACLNSKRSRSKFGLFERELNRLFIILIVLMLGMTILMLAPTGFEAKWYVTFLKYLLLFSTIVPLSLRISLDIAKYVYNRAIVMDKKIPKAMPRTTMIPEELGRIQYLLSDKTGTLTQNVISLEKLYVSRGFYTNEDVGVIKSKMDSFLRPAYNTAPTTPNSSGNLTMNAGVGGRSVNDKIPDVKSNARGTSARGSGGGTSTSRSIGNKGNKRSSSTSSNRGNVAVTSASPSSKEYEGAGKDSNRHDEKGGLFKSSSLESSPSKRQSNDRDEKEVIRDIFGANLGDSLESRLCLSLLSLGICHNVRPILPTDHPKSPSSAAATTTQANKRTNPDDEAPNLGTRDDAMGSPTRVGYHAKGLESTNRPPQDKEIGIGRSRSNMGDNGLNESKSSEGSDRVVGGVKIEKEEENVEFQASSPDEIALVKFAHLCGFKLVHRDDYCMRLLVNGLLLEFKILFMIPFSSETKRMGIIVEDSCGGKHLFIKGAEVVIIPFLLPRGSVWLSEECDNLARMGLRTLVFAYRPISDHEFTVFMAKYREANVSLEDRMKKIRNVQSTLEHGLTLVGLTGVRDQLQKNVAATLESLRNAGIKIWMLTGDKIDTAKCVAISAGLKQRHHTVYQISVESLVNPLINPSDTSKKHPERVEKEMIDFINSFDRTAHVDAPSRKKRRFWHSGQKAAQEGPSLDHPESEYSGERDHYEVCMNRVASAIEWNLEHFSMGPADSVLILDSFVLSIALDRLRKLLLKSSTLASSVLCCRCTPQMKADIVKLLKTNKQIVCCIGDGDNDVPMITEANVGIGIVGKEGLQASLSSDYSLVEFSHLKRLLLWHGRNSYKRSSKMSHFLMHRGVIISVMQAIFSSIYYFIPIAFFQGWLLVGFTSYYNMIPIFCLVLDVEICEEDVMLFPELYHELRRGRVMNVKTFLIWIWISLFQGTVLMTGAIILFENSLVSLIAIGCTSLFILEILNLVAELNSWHRLTIIGIMCTSVVYFYSLLVFRNNFDMEFIARKSFFWKVWVISFLGWVPVYSVKWLTNLLKPPQYVKLIVS